MNHFLDIDNIDVSALRQMLGRARELKKEAKAGRFPKLLENVQVALIFEKPSTRTRFSFEAGINQLGGHALVINSADTQLGRGETIADTARVLSRYVQMIMLRTYRHETLLELAKHSSAPVINGLTDSSHPCQVMADILTFQERLGDIAEKTVAWVGDDNNMVTSWAHAAEKFGFYLRISCHDELLNKTKYSSEYIMFCSKSSDAVKNADCVTTDTWVSMGDKNGNEKRKLLAPYQVNEKLMAQAAKHAIFLHCLPAHRGEEVTDAVMDGPQSAVWDEAENRLHIQKAIMLWCLGRL